MAYHSYRYIGIPFQNYARFPVKKAQNTGIPEENIYIVYTGINGIKYLYNVGNPNLTVLETLCNNDTFLMSNQIYKVAHTNSSGIIGF